VQSLIFPLAGVRDLRGCGIDPINLGRSFFIKNINDLIEAKKFEWVAILIEGLPIEGESKQSSWIGSLRHETKG
jgi:hypothetical protein